MSSLSPLAFQLFSVMRSDWGLTILIIQFILTSQFLFKMFTIKQIQTEVFRWLRPQSRYYSFTRQKLVSLSLLAAPTFLGLGVVGVSPKAVIQLLFVAVEAGATAGQAVHLGLHHMIVHPDSSFIMNNYRHRPILHVAALGVEVGHVPSILLVIVVVSVGAEIVYYKKLYF